MSLGNQDNVAASEVTTGSWEMWLVVASDITYTIFFFVYFNIYKWSSRRQISKVLQEYYSPQDYTVYVTNLPKECTKDDVEAHFSKWGKIVEVSFGRKFGRNLKLYLKNDSLNKKLTILDVKLEIKA